VITGAEVFSKLKINSKLEDQLHISTKGEYMKKDEARPLVELVLCVSFSALTSLVVIIIIIIVMCFCLPSSKIGSSPRKDCGGKCRPGEK